MPNRGTRWMVRWMAAGRIGHRHPPARRCAAAIAPSRAIGSRTPYRALVSTYCVSCHNSKAKAGGLELDAHQHAGSGRALRSVGKGRAEAARAADAAAGVAPARRSRARVRAERARSVARQRLRQRRRIRAAPIRSAGSTAPNITTPSAICSRSRSTRPRCCRATPRATASTTSRSAICRRRCSRAMCRRRRRSASSRSAARACRRAARPSAFKPDLTQEKHIDGLPLGTRGGALVSHEFPGQRRVRDHDSARARPQRAHRRAARAARDRAAARRRARAALHRSSRCR